MGRSPSLNLDQKYDGRRGAVSPYFEKEIDAKATKDNCREKPCVSRLFIEVLKFKAKNCKVFKPIPSVHFSIKRLDY